MKEQNQLGDKIATVFRVLGISQYSLLRQQNIFSHSSILWFGAVKFAFTVTTKQQLNTEAVFLHNHTNSVGLNT